jgi:hypothetical protein
MAIESRERGERSDLLNQLRIERDRKPALFRVRLFVILAAVLGVVVCAHPDRRAAGADRGGA